MKAYILGVLCALVAPWSAVYGEESPILMWESSEPIGPPAIASDLIPLNLEPLAVPLTPLPGTPFPLEAINIIENAYNTGGHLFIPPDPIGAVSATHLVNIVNVSIEWYQRSTDLREHSQKIGDTDGMGFFAPLDPANFLFDPKVIYDQYENRFVVVAMERQQTGLNPDPGNTSRILLAVSDDDDPNGSWCFQALDSKLALSGVEYWADYPGFAVDEDAVYVTANEYAFPPRSAAAGPYLWILAKGTGTSGLYDCGLSPVWLGDPGGFDVTTQPAQVFGADGIPPISGTSPNPGTYLVQYSGLSNGVDEAVNFILVDDPLGGPAFLSAYELVGNIDNTAVPMPDAPQLDTTARIETNDRRALNAVWRDDRLWTTAQVVPPDGSDAGQATAHWWQFDTTGVVPNSITLVQQGNVGGEDVAPEAYTFFPSIAVNANGDASIGFSVAASSIYPSAAYTLRQSADPLGTVQNSIVYAAGTDWYLRTFGTGSNRWGDYSGTVVDVNDQDFCVYNEYAIERGLPTLPGNEDGQWGTRWVCFQLDQEANLSITKSDNPDPVEAGDLLTYTLMVENTGPDEAVNVVVSDDLPTGVTFVSTAGCNEDPNGVPTCSLGSIPAGGIASYTITVSVDDGTQGIITNTASVDSDTSDPDLTDNSASEDTTVFDGEVADLALTKVQLTENPRRRQPIEYLVTVNNNGPSTAEDVTVEDTVSKGAYFDSFDPSCSLVGRSNQQSLVCDLGDLPSGDTRDLHITLVSTRSPVVNTAEVSADESEDPDLTNNSATVTTTLSR